MEDATARLTGRPAVESSNRHRYIGRMLADSSRRLRMGRHDDPPHWVRTVPGRAVQPDRAAGRSARAGTTPGFWGNAARRACVPRELSGGRPGTAGAPGAGKARGAGHVRTCPARDRPAHRNAGAQCPYKRGPGCGRRGRGHGHDRPAGAGGAVTAGPGRPAAGGGACDWHAGRALARCRALSLQLSVLARRRGLPAGGHAAGGGVRARAQHARHGPAAIGAAPCAICARRPCARRRGDRARRASCGARAVNAKRNLAHCLTAAHGLWP